MRTRGLSIKEISRLRGKLKARKRSISMAERNAKKIEKQEREYQEQLARDLNKFL